MKNSQASKCRYGVIAVALATLLLSTLGSTSAWACSEKGKGSHQGMAKQEHRDKGEHKLRPHNAAVHFLGMATKLDLKKDQMAKLVKLRDDYIVNNATGAAQLKAANHDLAALLHAADVDMKAVNAQLDKAGKLESQLWHAFAQQLHDIKAMLTPDQKMILNGKHKAGMAGKMCNIPNAKGGCDKCECATGGSCGCAMDGACNCGCAMDTCEQCEGAEGAVKMGKASHMY